LQWRCNQFAMMLQIGYSEVRRRQLTTPET
jgi:hypothetical protein